MSALYAIGDFIEYVELPVRVAPIPAVWFMLRLHPNYDLKAERQLTERGISVYVPKEKQVVRSSWNRKVQRIVPIFPGAMFVPDFDADLARLKRVCSGIGGFVKCAGEALRISPKTMTEIRRFEADRDPDQRRYRIDQKVRIVGGPFDMLEGRIERLDARFRIRVLIGLLQGEVSFELDEDQVEAI